MNLTGIRSSKTARRWVLVALTAVLAIIIMFLLYTSEDIHWGKDYWINWVIRHFRFDYLTASGLVKWLRKTLHFLGYGALGCLAWFYFYLWRIPKPLLSGLIFTTAVAILDEYTQSLTSFRSGKPGDVLLDITGAVVITGLVRFIMARKRNQFCDS